VSSASGSSAPGEHAVSCVIVTFNNEDFVAEAIESVLGQTIAPAEVVLVDSSSPDDTVEVARAYGDRLRIIEIDNISPAHTRNVGIESTGHPLITFLDGDDRWEPKKLEIQAAAMAADPGLDVTFTHVQNFWVEELAEERDYFRGQRRAAPMAGYATTTMMARRSAFERFGKFDPMLWFSDAHDWIERMRSAGGRDQILDPVLTWHRMHPGGISRRLSDDAKAEFLMHIRKYGLRPGKQSNAKGTR
jgi:glycosyltransferase involved in cell wall biosynthesis